MSAFIIKVTLEEVEPASWRRLEIPSGISFGDLHRILQLAFAWNDTHLHEFSFPEGRTLIGPPEGGSIYLDENTERVDDYLEKFPSILYIYDFGNEWRHRIVLEERDESYQKRSPALLSWAGGQMEENSGHSDPRRRRIDAKGIAAHFGAMFLEILKRTSRDLREDLPRWQLDTDEDEEDDSYSEYKDDDYEEDDEEDYELLEEGELEDALNSFEKQMNDVVRMIVDLVMEDPAFQAKLAKEPDWVQEALAEYRVSHNFHNVEPALIYMSRKGDLNIPGLFPPFPSADADEDFEYDDEEDLEDDEDLVYDEEDLENDEEKDASQEVEYTSGAEAYRILTERGQAEDSCLLEKVMSFNRAVDRLLGSDFSNPDDSDEPGQMKKTISFVKEGTPFSLQENLCADSSYAIWYLRVAFQLETGRQVPRKTEDTNFLKAKAELAQHYRQHPEDFFNVFDVEGFRALNGFLTVPSGPFELDAQKNRAGFAAAILCGLLDYAEEEKEGTLTCILRPAMDLQLILEKIEKGYKRKTEGRIAQSQKVERSVSLYGYIPLKDFTGLLDRHFKLRLTSSEFLKLFLLGSVMAGKVCLSAGEPEDAENGEISWVASDKRLDLEEFFRKRDRWSKIPDYKEAGKDQLRGELPLVGSQDEFSKFELFLSGRLGSRASYGPVLMNLLVDEIYKGRGISALLEIWETWVEQVRMPDPGMRVWFNLMNLGMNLGLPELKGFSRQEIIEKDPDGQAYAEEFMDLELNDVPERKTSLFHFPKKTQLQIYQYMKSGSEHFSLEACQKLEKLAGSSNQELESVFFYQLLAQGKVEEAESFANSIYEAHPEEQTFLDAMKKAAREHAAASLKEQILWDGVGFQGSLGTLPPDVRREIGRILNGYKAEASAPSRPDISPLREKRAAGTRGRGAGPAEGTG